MITVVTTYNLEIFKLFYEHKFHSMFKERLFLYVDQYDSSEFRAIVDPAHTKVFDKNDFIEYYGDNYLTSLTTFSKVYFLNMLLEQGLIDDSFYFTDDDVLLYDESFEDLKYSNDAIYAKDMILIIDRVYSSWSKLYSYITKNFDKNDNLCTCATNFYFPKRMIGDLTYHLTKVFSEFIDILYEDREYINEINEKSRSLRNASFSVFYLDTPFFNIVFPRLNKSNFIHCQIYLTTYSHFRKLRDSLQTNYTGDILAKYFTKKATYPKKQPLFHFSVNNKLPLMRDSFNYFNSKEYVCKDIDDIMIENPRELKKLNYKKSIKQISKQLF